MAGIKLRQSCPLADGTIRLFLRVTHRDKNSIVTLPYVLNQGEWMDETEQVVITPAMSYTRRKELEALREGVKRDKMRMQEVVERLDGQGEFRARDATSAYRHYFVLSDFSTYMQEFIDRQKEKVKEATLARYRSIQQSFLDFLGTRAIRLDELTEGLLREYVSYLQTGRKVKGSTIASYLSWLKTVWNQAVLMDGLLPRHTPSPFSRIEVKKEPPRKRALDEKEIKKIADILPLIDDESLKLAGYMFLFSFYCQGMPFVDLAHLTEENLSGDYLIYKRRKTEAQLKIKLLPEMREIIQMYSSDDRSYLFPLLRGKEPTRKDYQRALRVQNKRLKRLAKRVGIRKECLSTYVARHTWATIAKKRGVPEYIISSCLAHTSVRTTRLYIKVFDNKDVDTANAVVVLGMKVKNGTFLWKRRG